MYIIIIIINNNIIWTNWSSMNKNIDGLLLGLFKKPCSTSDFVILQSNVENSYEKVDNLFV